MTLGMSRYNKYSNFQQLFTTKVDQKQRSTPMYLPKYLSIQMIRPIYSALSLNLNVCIHIYIQVYV